MRVIRQARELRSEDRKVCLAIGVFDGVHLGHQQVIRNCILDARQHSALAVAVTFDRHPSSVVAPERAPLLIYSLEQRLREIGNLGVDAILLLSFTPEFSKQSGEQFIRSLASDFLQIQSISVGSSFTFGHKRSGNVELLKLLGRELNFAVHGMAALSLDKKIVSSTRIREAVRNGNLEAASQMLGRGYSVESTVIHGDQLGRKIGFPTANLDIAGLLTPPNGVYAVHARVGDEICRGVANIGVRPTLNNPTPQLRLEAHLLNWTGDLYGKRMELSFLGKIRPEQKFSSLEELKGRIGQDIQLAETFF